MNPTEYCDVFETLERFHIPYVVVSGAAVVLHGHIRPVFDLDIVISAKAEEQDRALAILIHAGFVPSIPVPLHMLTVLRMFDQTQRELDLFVKYYIPFDELWASSELKQLGDQQARVISLEHLSRAKRITGRPHDLLDIEALLALQPQGMWDDTEKIQDVKNTL